MSTEPSPSHMLVAPSPVDRVSYQKLPVIRDTYLAYVVAIRDPLNLHLDIYWSPEMAERYASALHYDYTFVSEELESGIHTRKAYSCHLRGVEIIPSESGESNTKEAYILVSSQIIRSGGWVVISVSDVDIYRRILVNIFDVVNRNSINQSLLNRVSTRNGGKIAREYVRPLKSKPAFSPNRTVPRDYHIVYEKKK